MQFGKHLIAAPAAALLGLVIAGAAQAQSFSFMTTTDGTPYMMETTPIVIQRSVVTSPTILDTTPTVITNPVTVEPAAPIIEQQPVIIRDRHNRSLLHFGVDPLLDLRLF